VTAVVARPSASVASYPPATTVILHESLPRSWKKADFKSTQFERFTWNSMTLLACQKCIPVDTLSCSRIMLCLCAEVV